jgi:trimethylamine:corrinoid methyltransferase-like protein
MDSTVKPVLRLLTEEQIRFVHDRSLTILSRVGMRIDSPRAREILLASEGVRCMIGEGSSPSDWERTERDSG